MTQTQFIAEQLAVPLSGIDAVLTLLNQDATVPFISRYRKDQTGNLDEVQIGQIVQLSREFQQITKRRASILETIGLQGALTDELEQRLNEAKTLVALEDLYLPFKKKRSTRASVAREKGLEPLARIMMAQNATNLKQIALKYVNQNVPDTAEALAGAADIAAEWISENLRVRNALRRYISRNASAQSKVITAKAQEENAQKYTQYFDWSEPLHRMPAHRLLAVLRADAEGFVRFKVAVDTDQAVQIAKDAIIKPGGHTSPELFAAIKDSYKRLLEPSLSNEVLQSFKTKADAQSIGIFAENLSQLLLSPPLGQKRILALDPGFKSGCKLVCLDAKGDLLHNETIYPHAPQNQSVMAMKKLRSLVNAYKIEAIAIGNGTASRETENLVKKAGFDRDVEVFVVNEAGASVYSASKIAREEFPREDVTVRGAVSIGRRLADPLAELVKIDPKAIGVGQYQHDVDQTALKLALDSVVESCVNRVGVNLNTAGVPLLSYVSGIGEKLAQNIVEYRTEHGAFSSREQLKKVPRLGQKAFEQAAAFVRVVNGEHPLDNSAVHPEAYAVVQKMARGAKLGVAELIGNRDEIAKINPENYTSETIGILALTDILNELKKPGIDPRKAAGVFEFDTAIKTLNDIRPGMVLPGIVNNITHFGCFVSVGIKESGLVHISELRDEFVSDVSQVVKLHQHVKVRVVEVDMERKRLQLSLRNV